MALANLALTNIEIISGSGITFPLGYKAGAVWCGLKSSRKDLALICSDLRASCAGVFTQNLVKASSVTYSQAVTRVGQAQAIFCNAGNANACTGDQGMLDTLACAADTAEQLGISKHEVLVAATGIIGVPLQLDKIQAGLHLIDVRRGSEKDHEVAQAILTTDTTAKQFAVKVSSPHWTGELRIGGVTKGSGMIAPNMATTLCFLTTDASISPDLLQQALSTSIDRTYNRLTVDGDTSTNDMALILANGAGPAVITEGPAHEAFTDALEAVCLELAKMIARDGEGATKLVGITVHGAATEAEATQVAKTIAESPLVKTALFGCDPNWGRVLAAAGRAGVLFNPENTKLWFGPHLVLKHGMPVSFDKAQAREDLKAEETHVVLDLGAGEKTATVWTCDYSYDYIRINAEYHT